MIENISFKNLSNEALGIVGRMIEKLYREYIREYNRRLFEGNEMLQREYNDANTKNQSQ